MIHRQHHHHAVFLGRFRGGAKDLQIIKRARVRDDCRLGQPGRAGGVHLHARIFGAQMLRGGSGPGARLELSSSSARKSCALAMSV
jgi:hypothetical protein